MVYGLCFMFYVLWFMVYGLWFMVHGLWFRVEGLGFRVWWGNIALLFETGRPVGPVLRPFYENQRNLQPNWSVMVIVKHMGAGRSFSKLPFLWSLHFDSFIKPTSGCLKPF